jgi:hypothetical protein
MSALASEAPPLLTGDGVWPVARRAASAAVMTGAAASWR